MPEGSQEMAAGPGYFPDDAYDGGVGLPAAIDTLKWGVLKSWGFPKTMGFGTKIV